MFKIILFLTLGLIILLLINKVIIVFTKNFTIRYLIFLLLTLLFLLFIFFFRNGALENNRGIYEPPEYNGEKVIPGRVVGE